MATQNITLPTEIITLILLRLPAKPLCRFKCVAKSWCSFINSPNFIKHHLNQSHNRCLIIAHHSIISAPITAVTDTIFRFSELNRQPLKHLPRIELIESCNGIVLISDFPKKTVFLYNPSNNTHRLIPPVPTNTPNPNPDQKQAYGFGYDNVTDDYKVVRMMQCLVDDYEDKGAGVVTEMRVYSLKKDLWYSVKDVTVTEIPKSEFKPFYLQPSNAVLAKETLYFSVIVRTGRNPSDFKPMYKCFDLTTEMFSFVDFPNSDSDGDLDRLRQKTFSMRDLRGCLCVLVNLQKKLFDGCDSMYNRRLMYSDVWELRKKEKEMCWVMLFRIRKLEGFDHCLYLRLVMYSNDGRRVLIEVDGMRFGWYDLETKRFEKVDVSGLREEDSPYMTFSLVESLVSVSSDKAVSNGGAVFKKRNKKNDFLSKGFKLKL